MQLTEIWTREDGYSYREHLTDLNIKLQDIINQGFRIVQVIPFHIKNYSTESYPRTAIIIYEPDFKQQRQ